jgi:hypothetical protein
VYSFWYCGQTFSCAIFRKASTSAVLTVIPLGLEHLLGLLDGIDALGQSANLLLRGPRSVEQQFLLGRREAVPEVEIDDQRRRSVIVIGHRAIFRDLVGLERQDIDDRQVGAVDDALLRGRDHLAPGHRHRDAAQTVDRVGEHLGRLHAQLEAAQILGRGNRAAVVPEMAEAVIVKAQDLELVFVLKLPVEAVADRPVEHLVGLVIALYEIGHQKDAHLREHRRGGATRVAYRDVAGFDRIDDLELLGQQRTGVKFDLEAAACLLVDSVGHLDKSDGGRFGRRHDMGHDEFLWRRLGERGSTTQSQNPGKPARRSAQQATAARHAGSDKNATHRTSSRCA